VALRPGPASRLTIFVTSNDQWHHRPLYSEIVRRAHAAGLAGATVVHGVEGFGSSATVHTTRLLSLSDDLPSLVLVVDAEERLRAFLAGVRELVGDRLVLLEPVEVV
jgi:PII-like signaling protein